MISLAAAKTMKIKNFKINDLIQADYNPRQLSKDQFKTLKDSLEEFGFVDPVIINSHPDRKNIIIGGHQRVKVAKEIGITEVPCFEIKLSLEKEKELNVRLNKNTGDWDWDALANNFDVGELLDWGFSRDELQVPEEEKTGNIEDDEVPIPEEPICKEGDLWKLGDHRLLCGDATSEENTKRLMNGLKADMIFTDPPYGVSYTGVDNGKGTKWEMIKNDDLRNDSLYHLLKNSFQNCYNYSKNNPAVYVWHASINQMIFETALKDCSFEVKQQLIWNKGMKLGRSDYHWMHEPLFYARKEGNNNEWYGDRKNKTILRNDTIDLTKVKKKDLIKILNTIADESTCWEIKKDSAIFYVHPTQKPVDLCVKAALNNTKDDEIILDLFLGSGSTMIAAEKINRRCYGMELDPKYCDIIINRWEEYTGGKAEKVK